MNLSLSATLSKQIADENIEQSDLVCVATIGKPFHLEGLFHLQAPPGKVADLHLWGIDPTWRNLAWNFRAACESSTPIPCKVTKGEETGKTYLGISALKSTQDVTTAAGSLLYVGRSKLWQSELPRVKLLSFEGLPIQGTSGSFTESEVSYWITRGNIFLLGIHNTKTNESIDLPLDWHGWQGYFSKALTDKDPPSHIELNLSEEQLWESIRG